MDKHGYLTDEDVIRTAMRLLGKRKSERKTLSCRANAKLPRQRKTKQKQPTIYVEQ